MSEKKAINKRYRINLDYSDLSVVIKEIEELREKQGEILREYFEIQNEWEYGSEYTCVYYVFVRMENDAEYEARIAQEVERSKTQEDREREQLAYLQAKYKDA